jgi:predicted small metal-binding protein
MKVTELNPSNEALTQLREHWQQVLMHVMKKHGIKEVTIDMVDMQWLVDLNAQGKMPVMVTKGRKQLGPDGGFTLILCDSEQEAMEIVAKHHGRG